MYKSVICRAASNLSRNNVKKTLSSSTMILKEVSTQIDAQESDAMNQTPKQKTLTNFEKKLLVQCGKYKSLNEVPNSVCDTVLEKAKDKFRVKVNIAAIFATLIACLGVALYAKSDVESGATINKNYEDFKSAISNGKGEK